LFKRDQSIAKISNRDHTFNIQEEDDIFSIQLSPVKETNKRSSMPITSKIRTEVKEPPKPLLKPNIDSMKSFRRKR